MGQQEQCASEPQGSWLPGGHGVRAEGSRAGCQRVSVNASGKGVTSSPENSGCPMDKRVLL